MESRRHRYPTDIWVNATTSLYVKLLYNLVLIFEDNRIRQWIYVDGTLDL